MYEGSNFFSHPGQHLLLFVFVILAILVCVWNDISLWFWFVSLMNHYTKQFFINVFTICTSLDTCIFNFLLVFKIWLFNWIFLLLSCKEIFYIFWIQVSIRLPVYNLKTFSPILSLVFSLSWWCSLKHKQFLVIWWSLICLFFFDLLSFWCWR